MSPKDRVLSLSNHLSYSQSENRNDVQLNSTNSPDIESFRRAYSKPQKDGIVLGGLSHLALVSSDMNRTVEFFSGKLGLALVKTIALPDGGQHFFFDVGKGECLAYFWFPKAPKHAPGVATVDQNLLRTKGEYATAHGSMNHVAFQIPADKLKEYQKKLRAMGVECSPIIKHTEDDDPKGKLLFLSIYFFGPDGEYLEFTSQMTDFTEMDVRHLPKIVTH